MKIDSETYDMNLWACIWIIIRMSQGLPLHFDLFYVDLSWEVAWILDETLSHFRLLNYLKATMFKNDFGSIYVPSNYIIIA